MVGRCTRPYHDAYARYGAVGITVCDQWLSFEVFLADMGERKEGTTIDRIDGSKGYFPGNCRWSPIHVQQSNMKSNVHIEYLGERKHIREWARLIGCDSKTLSYRLKSGWSVKDALTTSPKLGNRNSKNGQRLFEYQGKSKCISEWARDFNMSASLLSLRLKNGMNIADALEKPKGVFVTKKHY
jgi:hypothetical protein